MHLKKFFFILLLLFAQAAIAVDYYCDPVNGSLNNNGLSPSAAWPDLESVLKEKSFSGGDIIYLMSGNHGSPFISAKNSTDVVITRHSNETPIVKTIRFSGASHWKVENVEITTEGARVPANPPLSHPVYPLRQNSLVQIINNSSFITISDCSVYSIENSSEWTKDDWNYKAWNGIYNTDNSDVTIRNCHLKNINFAIHNTKNCTNNLYENNIIENFSGDGLRAHGTNTIIQYNTVKNAYNTNGNHDDLVQAFQGNQVGLVLRGNKLIAWTDPNQPFKSSCQGIGFFDGIYHDFIIENNVVATTHWHGITLLGAKNCTIINNTVVDIDNTDSPVPWITIDKHKDGTPSSGCVVRNNISPSFKNGEGVQSDHNLKMASAFYSNNFVDFENLDLHLLESSAAVNAGSAGGAPSIDIEKTPRPQGEEYDIGAYEFRKTTGYDKPEWHPSSNPKIYPNPTTGEIHFEFPQMFSGKIIISDITGKTVLEKQIYAQTGSLNLTGTNSGIYFMHIGADINSRHKIVKK